MASTPIYEIDAELTGVEPAAWRRMQVTSTTKMNKFAYQLMIALRMEASHLYAIEYSDEDNTVRGMSWDGNERDFPTVDVLQLPDPEEEDLDFPGRRLHDIRKFTVAKWFGQHPAGSTFKYDFGDGWEVALTVKRIITSAQINRRSLPRVVAGAGYGIIENIGGEQGLNELYAEILSEEPKLRFLKNTDHGLEPFFNPEWMRKDEINERLKRGAEIYQRVYEERQAPKVEELDFLANLFWRLDWPN